MTFLPTFAATGWYHNMLSPELQALPLEAFIDQVRDWTLDEYAPAMAKGERLKSDEHAKIAVGLAKYTGLSLDFVEASNLRINDGKFRKELLRAQRRTVGRMDSRYIGMDRWVVGGSRSPEPVPLSSVLPVTWCVACGLALSLIALIGVDGLCVC